MLATTAAAKSTKPDPPTEPMVQPYSEQLLIGSRLRDARHKAGLTQSQFAEAINKVLSKRGITAACSKRLVQKWEAGTHSRPVPKYQYGITLVTLTPYDELCRTQILIKDHGTGQELSAIARELGDLQHRLGKVLSTIDFNEADA